MTDNPSGSGVAHPDDERLDAVVNGLAAPETLARFIDHLRECPPCEIRFQDQVARFERLRSRPTPVRDAGGEFVLPEPPARLVSVNGARWRKPLIPALVGMAALAAVLLLMLRPVGPVYDRWLPSGSGEVLLRSVSTDDPAFREGLVAYDARDAARAAEVLPGATPPEGREAFHRLYTASALVLVGNWTEAGEVLETLSPRDLPEPWRGEADWLRYRVFQETARDDDAAQILRRLESRDDALGAWVRDLDLP